MRFPEKYNTPLRVFYNYAFNLYAWYWLYKLLFVLPFDWENIANWIFACCGMWFFVIDSGDNKFKRIVSKNGYAYPNFEEDNSEKKS